ncbi:MAG: peptidoglycan bridge formation glycyltransferase FemA/FemB family protein, partial [Parcubacteria group bacterium]
IFFNKTVTYLHGASDDRFRNVMAPYLLQWRQIKDAKKNGAIEYAFGGVKTNMSENNWEGITRFKQSFSPQTQTIKFPGAYDIIINAPRYWSYRMIQKIKSFL